MEFLLAGFADIPQLVELRLVYLEEDRGPLDLSQRSVFSERLITYFQEHLNKGLFAYSIKEPTLGQIVSIVLLQVVERPPNFSFPTGRTGTLLNVYTRPEFRRKGFASALIRQVIADAPTYFLSFLELSATPAGLSLYEKLGFLKKSSHYTEMKLPLLIEDRREPDIGKGGKCL